MQSNIYNDSLNDFSRKYLIKGNEHLIQDFRDFPIEFDNEISKIGERLLIHDSITFKVYGENIPLALLINKFGLKTFEELLEQNAIKFLLWNSDITYAIKNVSGLNPLQSFVYSSSVHSDPEASIYYGMNFMSDTIPRRVKRDITRKVLKKYIIPSEEMVKNSVSFGHEGYRNNLFNEFGLNSDKKIDSLNSEEKKLLIELTNQCYKLALLSKYQLNIYNSPELLQLNRKEFEQLKNINAVDDIVDTVFNFEKLPSFFEMIKEGNIDIRDISKMRNSISAKNFRKWIHSLSIDNNDRDDILREYMENHLLIMANGN